MTSRMVLWTIALAACSFRYGVAPPDATDAAEDTLPIDAPGCTAIDVAAGGDHTCAITVDGSLYCWGRGDDGQIGIDPLTSRCVSSSIFCQKTPAKISGPATLAVGLGLAHTCSSTPTQGYCWGKNATGQYGNGSTNAGTKPVVVGQRAGATVHDGGTGHGCSLANGSVACSGANTEGQVGNLSVVQQPTAVVVKADALALDVGSATSCAIDTARRLYCWGRNQYRTIDSNTTTIKTVPTLVAGITMVDDVAVGADHICAVSGGAAKCWGLNTSGQIGNGQINNMSQPQPITTVGLENVVEVAASRNHSCARTAGGDVYCFGEGYGAVPMMIASGATKITAGSSHDCAVMTDGTVRCWGDQLYGQLGNDVDSVTRTTTPQLARLCP